MKLFGDRFRYVCGDFIYLNTRLVNVFTEIGYPYVYRGECVCKCNISVKTSCTSGEASAYANVIR
jgi:hypothetical protein